MDKQRTIIFYKDYFEEFFEKQREKVKAKIIWTLELIKNWIEFLKRILNTLKIRTGFLKLEFNKEAIFLESFAFLIKDN